MGSSRVAASTTLLLSLNLLFFTMVNSDSCPIDTLKLRVCANALGIVQIPPNEQCFSLLGNLVAVDAAVCLCTAIRANVLGIDLDVPFDLSLLLNTYAMQGAFGFKCT